MTNIIHKVHTHKLDDHAASTRKTRNYCLTILSERLEISHVQDAVSSGNLRESLRAESAKHVSGHNHCQNIALGDVQPVR